ncbi:MAG: TolC family protein [Candidatus Eisenbacteria bacterium]|uniref:TolC family protein n=1 Tax=Eiseniibacteriota bacterium TaxID=2212470 RepID=A0A948RWK2_UNCEI|nr:TolC family protein [Candidatus Eisenbacteria bacterium]MBU1947850.1 TolC family protein [Candidatus Eisenbacteria bacterium]MBU2690342.1 TolC family protein [Candidatus Eisenbacteria bacterium]
MSVNRRIGMLGRVLMVGGMLWLSAIPEAYGAPEGLPPFPWDLSTSLALAGQGNLDLAQAEAATYIAEGSYHRSLGGYLPSLGASYNFNRSGRDFASYIAEWGPVAADKGASNSWSLGASLRQSLIDLPTAYTIRSSKKQMASARYALKAAELDVALAVTQQHYALMYAVKLSQVANEAVQLATDQFRRTESLYELGSVPRADVLQSRVSMASSELDLISARNTVRNQQAELALALGLPSNLEIIIDTTVSIPDLDRIWDETELAEMAMRDRADLLQARIDLRAMQDQVSSRKWSHWPTMGMSLYYSKQEETFDESLKNLDANLRWGLSVSLDMNLNPIDHFLVGSTKGSVEEAVWRERQQKRGLQKKELEVLLEIRQAILAWEEGKERLASAQENLTYAQENLKLQKALYEGGGGTLLEWNNAQVELTRARVEVVDAQVSILTAKASLERSVGQKL